MGEFCVCRANKGFKQINNDWVCANCLKPSQLYYKLVVFPKIVLGEERYDNLSNSLEVFVGRMKARREQEITAYVHEYGLAENFVRFLFSEYEKRNA